MQRRAFVLGTAGLLCAASTRADEKRPVFKLGFSLYGMKSLPIAEGIAACAEIGFECTELPVMHDWPADSALLTDKDVEAIREASAKHKLPILALMENLKLAADDAQHAKNLARLERAAAIARRLSSDAPPVIETILGGSPQQRDASRDAMADRLRDWVRIAESAKVPLAIKAHVNNAAHLPEHLLWLLERAPSDYLRVAYDYSHYQLRGLELEASYTALAKHVAFIHVKDATGEPGKFQFLLPGEGSTDYRKYFALLTKLDYRGPVIVEVSGQIHGRAGYDPLLAARACHKALDAARSAR